MSEVLTGALYRIETKVREIETAIPPMAQALAVIGSKVQTIDRQVEPPPDRASAFRGPDRQGAPRAGAPVRSLRRGWPYRPLH